MRLFDRWNWWLPEWAARIVRVKPSPLSPTPGRARAGPDHPRAVVAGASRRRWPRAPHLGARPRSGPAPGARRRDRELYRRRRPLSRSSACGRSMQLHASQVELSFGFLCGAMTAPGGGVRGRPYLDHVGRRPVLLDGRCRPGARAARLPDLGRPARAGARAGSRSSPSSAPARAGGPRTRWWPTSFRPKAARRVTPAVRVAKNLGVSFGPAIGGLLLLDNSWSRLFVGVFAMAAVAWVCQAFTPCLGGRYVPDAGAGARIVRRRPARPHVPALRGCDVAGLDDLRRVRLAARDLASLTPTASRPRPGASSS